MKDSTARLLEGELRDLLTALGEPEDESVLEVLLFHGRQVARHLEAHGCGSLSTECRARLERELARTHVVFSLRVVDRSGTRVEMIETVPIGSKQHLHPSSVHDVASPEVSFTVQRVGLRHLWTRL